MKKKIENINKAKSCFLKRLKEKINKTLANSSKKEGSSQ